MKDESVPGKNFNFGRDIIKSNRIAKHREKEYIDTGVLGLNHSNLTKFKYA